MPKSLLSVLDFHNKHVGRISEFDLCQANRNAIPLETRFPKLKALLQAARLIPPGPGDLALVQVKGTSFQPRTELARLKLHLEMNGMVRWEATPEPDNPEDPHALAVYAHQGDDPHPNHVLLKPVMVGYVPKPIAAVMDAYLFHIAGHLTIEELGKTCATGPGQALSIRLLGTFVPKTAPLTLTHR